MSVCMLICRGIQNQSSMNNITCGICMWKRWLADLLPTWWSFRCNRQVFETEGVISELKFAINCKHLGRYRPLYRIVNITGKWYHYIKVYKGHIFIFQYWQARKVKFETEWDGRDGGLKKKPAGARWLFNMCCFKSLFPRIASVLTLTPGFHLNDIEVDCGMKYVMWKPVKLIVKKKKQQQ